MLFVFVQGRRIVQIHHQAVYARTHETVANKLLKHMQVFALAFVDDRRQHHDALIGHALYDLIHHLTHRLGIERQIVSGTARFANAGEEQAQVVVNLGNGSYG